MNASPTVPLSLPAILRIAGNAYAEASDGLCTLPQTREEALAHTNGDTLADFIILELHEALDGEPPNHLLSRAIDTLSTARDQLNAVISALEDHLDPDASPASDERTHRHSRCRSRWTNLRVD